MDGLGNRLVLQWNQWPCACNAIFKRRWLRHMRCLQLTPGVNSTAALAIVTIILRRRAGASFSFSF